MNSRPRPATDSELWKTPLEGLPRKDTAQAYRTVQIRAGLWEAEHRMVLAQTLGRPLRSGESAHHKNKNPYDNRPENLELWVGGIRAGARAVDLTCPHCGEAYLKTRKQR